MSVLTVFACVCLDKTIAAYCFQPNKALFIYIYLLDSLLSVISDGYVLQKTNKPSQFLQC